MNILPGAASNPADLPRTLAELDDRGLILLADELIKRGREKPGNGMAGPDITLAQLYLGELNRRATDRQTRAAERQTRTVNFLAWAVAAMTVVQTVIAGITFCRGH